MADDDSLPQIEYSPLCQALTHHGVTVRVDIYRVDPGPWTLEVEDAEGTSHVWDDTFESDAQALAEATRALQEEPAEFTPGIARSPNATLALSDLLDAFDWVNAGAAYENGAYAHRQTGRIYWVSSEHELEDEEEVPDDVDDRTQYAAIPHKNDLDLGQDLVFRFVQAQAPALMDTVRDHFRRRGAYGRFKGLLERQGLLEAWYRFEGEATEAALREWAEGEGFGVVG